jgi:hypothetical protein
MANGNPPINGTVSLPESTKVGTCQPRPTPSPFSDGGGQGGLGGK